MHQVNILKHSENVLNLNLDIEKTWIEKDGSVIGKISATYRWGAPYANQSLNINLPRNQQLKVITDDNGKAEFSYSPQFFNPDTILGFSISTTDNKHQSDLKQVLYAPIPFSILAASEHLSLIHI